MTDTQKLQITDLIKRVDQASGSSLTSFKLDTMKIPDGQARLFILRLENILA